jgi:outer membrane scaffolding protein for murein synthesis (MipA/OmpV family)
MNGFSRAVRLKGSGKMCARLVRPALASPQLACLTFALWAHGPRMALCQTPSPLQEWQYSGGIILAKLFLPNLPEWRVVLGAATEAEPPYDGASAYRVRAGPVINIRYRDLAFFSVGEGLGVNVLRGDNYAAGVSIGYDLGRRVSDDFGHLHGLGDISPAPFVRLFGSYVISKQFPLVLRMDVRRIVGGADGVVGDVEAYLPLPGSSKTFIMFAGPSFTFADHQHMQTSFGVSTGQALASGLPFYMAHGGANSAGFGFGATRFITPHWLINADAAVNRLLGSARESPITQSSRQVVFALSVDYTW